VKGNSFEATAWREVVGFGRAAKKLAAAALSSLRRRLEHGQEDLRGGDVLECGEAPGAFYRPMQRGEWTGSHRVAGEWSFYSFHFKTARRGGDPEGAAKICKVGVGGSAPRDAQGGTVQGGGGRPT
jgi:hypothetical protein